MARNFVWRHGSQVGYIGTMLLWLCAARTVKGMSERDARLELANP